MAHLQVQRHPVPRAPSTRPRSPRRRLVERARDAIERADRQAASCRFKGPQTPKYPRVRQAYGRAFDRCAELLDTVPGAFVMPWFKAFWQRNYEALVVRSVVRNHQEDIDSVRRWLDVRTQQLGRFESPASRGEQGLVDSVIDALYFHEQDRQRLKADALVRLLEDPSDRPLDFSVVSCMGVVTEGATGRELEETFGRLEAAYGIGTVRANTAIMRSLDHNAERILETVRTLETPWGYVGYSQGCANGLRAESLMMGGTPADQRLLDGLRCRNLLFAAANGSTHGTCGDVKLLNAIVDGERFLKHYQAVLSDRAIQTALRGLRLALTSRELVVGIGGMHSLSHRGVILLFRDGQFKSTAPTNTVRGICRPETTPEALEWLANVMTRQDESPDHDTQVACCEAVGHSVWLANAQTRVLERCDMGGMVQATHHWSPLLHEAEFLMTERDHERAIYDSPKDRHVFPWVEVNARFGVIRPR